MGSKYINKCRQNLYPVNAKSDRRNFDTLPGYPVKASGDFKMDNCFQLPYILGSSLPIALIKKIKVSRYTGIVVQKFHIQ
jgi:hypothetical protein